MYITVLKAIALISISFFFIMGSSRLAYEDLMPRESRSISCYGLRAPYTSTKPV
jgi:hypothetical protein